MSPGCAQRNIPGAPGGGGGSSTFLPIAPIIAVIQKLLAGPAHTDVANRPPGLSTRTISLAAFSISGKNMNPMRQLTASKVALGNGEFTDIAAHGIIIPQAFLGSMLAGHLKHPVREILSGYFALWNLSGNCQAWFSSASSHVEYCICWLNMDVLYDRITHRFEKIHGELIPLSPAGREFVPGGFLLIADFFEFRFHRNLDLVLGL